MTRTFQATPAVRGNVPLLIALIGPSGGGKTYSALRLAKGIQRVQPGPIDVIDTEANRALHYADEFAFNHVPFDPPFGSLDYLEALRQRALAGTRTVIVDSMSHEHEGPGGMLDLVERDLDERVQRKLDDGNRDPEWKIRQRLQMSAFIKPKAYRVRLIQGILQLKMNLIMCFRAKDKIQPVPGGEPKHLGYMPIGGEEFWYEMTARALLLPGANGVPTWSPSKEHDGEKLAVRRPKQFENILASGAQLSEDMGEQMAVWASGSAALDVDAAVARVKAAATKQELTAVAGALRARPWGPDDRNKIAQAYAARQSELKTKE